ncbi:MAG: RsmB/NOP family class I SAM-dependent RNA methyltransferase [Alphaproteobacteria bacterium]
MSVENSSADVNVDGLAARRAALAVLHSVLNQRQALDHVLDGTAAFLDLPSRDKAFARMVISTTLRRLGQVDAIIVRAQAREGTRTPVLENILRIGVVQILFMAVPDHAAVDTCVELARENKLERQTGFVNGLLRNVVRSGPEWLSRQDDARLNTPEWMLKAWISDYGMRGAAEIAQANLSEAPLDITVKNKGDVNHYASIFKATQLLTGTLRQMSGGRVNEMEGFTEGDWWVQDASAAIPAQLFGDIAGREVVDFCAAPGGKSVQMAAMGADVIALDRSPKRLKRVAENAERLGLSERITIQVADAAEWRPSDNVARPYILLDAPCSATGTIRRHPDALHLKAEGDVARLVDVQARILGNAFDVLSIGGILVYCVCSLQKAEGEAQIEAFLNAHSNAARLPITAEELGGYDESLTEDGDLRILPHHQAAIGGMDGFFVARVTKVG